MKQGTEVLMDIQYLPSIAWYQAAVKAGKLELEQWEHYQKVSYKNRCWVAGANGRVMLSVPLEKGKGQRTLMKDVKLSYKERWNVQHWRTLESNYRRSPYFEYLEADFRQLYERQFVFLMDMNLQFMEVINRILGFEPEMKLTEVYRKEPETGMLDLRAAFRPSDQEQPSGEGLPAYQQVFEDRTGFLPNLSIADLLFCEGRHGFELLKGA
jgi:hypothetical protein